MVQALALVADRYRLIRKLGQGAMGSLWEAQHVALRSPVAIKFIRQALDNNDEAVARFTREARAAAALRSPHVVQIIDHGVHDDKPFIAMELLEGETLAERIERQGTLSAQETATVLTHVGRALTRAHEAGIVHRDLKPSNVFVVSNDDEMLVKVFDFGIAKALNPGDSWSGKGTNSGVILGTPFYMSPEQAEGGRPIEPSTDIWAMGVMAFECLLGKLPFVDSSLGALVLAICSRPLPVPSAKGAVPEGFDAWFAKACARDPLARFATAKEAAAEFRRLVLGTSTPPKSEQTPTPLSNPSNARLGHTDELISARGNPAPEPTSVGEAGGDVALTSTNILPLRSKRARFAPLALCIVVGIVGVAVFFKTAEPTAKQVEVQAETTAPRAASAQAAQVPPPVVEQASGAAAVPAQSAAAQLDAVPSAAASAPAITHSGALGSERTAPKGSPVARRVQPKPAPPAASAPPVSEKKRRVDLGI